MDGVAAVFVRGFTQHRPLVEPGRRPLPTGWDTQAEVPGGAGLPGHRGLASATEVGQGCWVGYSQGARLCLQLALDIPRSWTGSCW